jgi:hypothetical protein
MAVGYCPAWLTSCYICPASIYRCLSWWYRNQGEVYGPSPVVSPTMRKMIGKAALIGTALVVSIG